MIITCASCLTKFNLDDSRISQKGVKVRCSRCHHVFYVVPPPETREEVMENFESFAKYHEDLMVRERRQRENRVKRRRKGSPCLHEEKKRHPRKGRRLLKPLPEERRGSLLFRRKDAERGRKSARGFSRGGRGC